MEELKTGDYEVVRQEENRGIVVTFKSLLNRRAKGYAECRLIQNGKEEGLVCGVCPYKIRCTLAGGSLCRREHVSVEIEKYLLDHYRFSYPKDQIVEHLRKRGYKRKVLNEEHGIYIEDQWNKGEVTCIFE